MTKRIEVAFVAATLLMFGLVGSARADRGYYGWGLKCSDCTLQTTDAGMRFRFTSPPEISGVEPGGPADRAGLRAGDVLLSVDGRPLTQDPGADLLTSVSPGTLVRIAYRRGSDRRDARITVGSRADGTPDIPGASRETSVASGNRVEPPRDAPIRFAGDYSGVAIEVRGAPDVRILMPADDSWMEIVSGDIRVRIRRGSSAE